MNPDVSMRKGFSTEKLSAETPLEFRQLLEKIRAASGLSCGQIAVKTRIPRSQAYNLVSSSRTTLPRRPEQVKAFVIACGLPVMQVEIVMGVWRQLNEQFPIRTVGANGAVQEADEDIGDDDDCDSDRRSVRANQRVQRRRGRDAVGADLLFLVLDSDMRTRRALLLIYPLVGTYVITLSVIALLVWSDDVSSAALIPMLTALFAIPAAAIRKLGRRR